MKKNTLSLLETIKRKIKKIDDSEDQGSSSSEIDQEFEYLGDDPQPKAKGKKDSHDNSEDSDNVEDIKLEADIENSASDAHSAGDLSVKKDDKKDSDAKDEDLESESQSDDDDFDLTFENHDDLDDDDKEDGYLEGEDDSVADNSSSSKLNATKDSDFEELEDFNLDDDSDQKQEKEPKPAKANGSSKGDDDVFDVDSANSDSDVDKELFGLDLDDEDSSDDLPSIESANKKAKVEEVENDPLGLGEDDDALDISPPGASDRLANPPKEDFDDLESDDLGILDESHFADQPQSQQSEGLEDQEEKKGGFTAKSLTEIIAEEKLQKEQEEQALQKQEPNDDLDDILDDEIDDPESVDMDKKEPLVQDQASEAKDDDFLTLDEERDADAKGLASETIYPDSENNLEENEDEASKDVDEEEISAEDFLNEKPSMPTDSRSQDQEENQKKEMEALIGEDDPLNSFDDDLDFAEDDEQEKTEKEDLGGDALKNSDFLDDKQVPQGEFLPDSKAVEKSSQEDDKDSMGVFDEDDSLDLDSPSSSHLGDSSSRYTAKDVDDDIVINSEIASKVANSIHNLQSAKEMVGKVESYVKGDLLSNVAFDLMKPKLEQWLNDNLPGLVENVVREEIKRIISDSNKH